MQANKITIIFLNNKKKLSYFKIKHIIKIDCLNLKNDFHCATATTYPSVSVSVFVKSYLFLV